MQLIQTCAPIANADRSITGSLVRPATNQTKLNIKLNFFPRKYQTEWRRFFVFFREPFSEKPRQPPFKKINKMASIRKMYWFARKIIINFYLENGQKTYHWDVWWMQTVLAWFYWLFSFPVVLLQMIGGWLGGRAVGAWHAAGGGGTGDCWYDISRFCCCLARAFQEVIRFIFVAWSFAPSLFLLFQSNFFSGWSLGQQVVWRGWEKKWWISPIVAPFSSWKWLAMIEMSCIVGFRSLFYWYGTRVLSLIISDTVEPCSALTARLWGCAEHRQALPVSSAACRKVSCAVATTLIRFPEAIIDGAVTTHNFYYPSYRLKPAGLLDSRHLACLRSRVRFFVPPSAFSYHFLVSWNVKKIDYIFFVCCFTWFCRCDTFIGRYCWLPLPGRDVITCYL